MKKKRINKQWHSNPKNYRRILWKTIYQQAKQPRRNGYVSRNVQPTKTELRRDI